MIMQCAHNVNGVKWIVGATRNESENFVDVMDELNITVAQSQDTSESESWQTWRAEGFMFLMEKNNRS